MSASGDCRSVFDEETQARAEKEEEHLPEYEVQLTDEAFYAYASLPSQRLFEHVDRDLALLKNFPFIGREYDPAYEAVRLAFPCRVFFCEHFGIYYRVYEDDLRITVFAIVDQRRNPEDLFGGFSYDVESLG